MGTSWILNTRFPPKLNWSRYFTERELNALNWRIVPQIKNLPIYNTYLLKLKIYLEITLILHKENTIICFTK